MSLLRRMKRDLTRINTPTREKQVCRALQTIFHDMEVGLSVKEAFQIIGWDYETKEELFSIHDKEDLTVAPYEDCTSIIFNSSIDKELDGIDGAIVFNLTPAE